MIFFENWGYFLPKKISMNILFQLHLNNQNIVPFINVEFIQARKGRISWLKTENTTIKPDKILRPLFLAVNTASYQQINQTISSGSQAVNHQLLNYGNVQILNSQMFGVSINYKSLNTASNFTFIRNENTYKYQSTFEHKSPAILSRDNLSFNSAILCSNRPFFKELNQPVNRPLIKKYYSYGYGTSSSVQRRYAYKTVSESLRFRDPRRVEMEIEQIKKIVTETKESVLGKPAPSFGEADIKRYLDINRISDQVYQNLERTIRMEKDRRGM
ncbi:MAG: hypothetical protein ACM3RX_02630 [Methanococcaceae archaeon]